MARGFPRTVAFCNAVPVIGADEVTELRTLMRRRDPGLRREAVDVLAAWSADVLAPDGVVAALDAATIVYPAVPDDPRHPDEMWVRLLWGAPDAPPVHDVLRVYSLAGERVRRALLHLLALRADADGIDALVELLGNATRADQLPSPSYVTIEPTMEHPDALRLVPALVGLAGRTGWAWEASGALRQLELDGRLGHAERRVVVEGVAPLVCTLVDTCDRAVLRQGDRVDVARVDRDRVRVLSSLLAVLPGADAVAALYRMLSSADPQVAAHGAVALVARGEQVAPERFELLSRDPVARVELYEGLAAEGVLTDVPELFGDDVALAESHLVRWLSAATELGRHPDEIEHVGPYTVVTDDGPSQVHVFRFRMRAPHWSSSRGWLIGAAGEWAHSCYLAEDDCDMDAHLAALLDSVAVWDAD